MNRLLQRGLLKLPNISDEMDEDAMCNITCKFDMTSKVKFKGSGKIWGTTYSGHPTATTLMGTLRNFLYHLYVIW